MSNSDWEAAYWRDQRYPAGIGGRSYVRGTRPAHGDFVRALRHLKRLQHPTPEQVHVVAAIHGENKTNG